MPTLDLNALTPAQRLVFRLLRERFRLGVAEAHTTALEVPATMAPAEVAHYITLWAREHSPTAAAAADKRARRALKMATIRDRAATAPHNT